MRAFSNWFWKFLQRGLCDPHEYACYLCQEKNQSEQLIMPCECDRFCHQRCLITSREWKETVQQGAYCFTCGVYYLPVPKRLDVSNVQLYQQSRTLDSLPFDLQVRVSKEVIIR